MSARTVVGGLVDAIVETAKSRLCANITPGANRESSADLSTSHHVQYLHVHVTHDFARLEVSKSISSTSTQHIKVSPKSTTRVPPTMRPAARLCQAVRITLFTRPNCGLCDSAKTVLASLGERRPFSYREVDIGKPDAKAWRDLYDFDVPVVRSPFLSSPLFLVFLLPHPRGILRRTVDLHHADPR